MKKISKINKKGFTLVEMMLVVAIIVILAGVATISIGTVLQNSKKKQNQYKSEHIPAVDNKAESVRDIMKSTPSAKLPS